MTLKVDLKGYHPTWYNYSLRINCRIGTLYNGPVDQGQNFKSVKIDVCAHNTNVKFSYTIKVQSTIIYIEKGNRKTLIILLKKY